jgi:hypothetical protein
MTEIKTKTQIVWDKEAIAQLKKYIDHGLTSGQIAKKFTQLAGVNITQNNITQRCCLLKLKSSSKYMRNKAEPKRQEAQPNAG